MDDALLMQELEEAEQLFGDLFYLSLRHGPARLLVMVLEVVIQVAMLEQLGDDIEIGIIMYQLVKRQHVVVLNIFEKHHLLQKQLLRLLLVEHQTKWHLFYATPVPEFNICS